MLLHASYPFTREAGYLAAVYRNVFLDFGEVFPFVSAEGQRAVVRQVLELSPTTKIMWSTDGHWWPETYYLGTLQAREVLFEVSALRLAIVRSGCAVCPFGSSYEGFGYRYSRKAFGVKN